MGDFYAGFLGYPTREGAIVPTAPRSGQKRGLGNTGDGGRVAKRARYLPLPPRPRKIEIVAEEEEQGQEMLQNEEQWETPFSDGQETVCEWYSNTNPVFDYPVTRAQAPQDFQG